MENDEFKNQILQIETSLGKMEAERRQLGSKSTDLQATIRNLKLKGQLFQRQQEDRADDLISGVDQGDYEKKMLDQSMLSQKTADYQAALDKVSRRLVELDRGIEAEQHRKNHLESLVISSHLDGMAERIRQKCGEDIRAYFCLSGRGSLPDWREMLQRIFQYPVEQLNPHQGLPEWNARRQKMREKILN